MNPPKFNKMSLVSSVAKAINNRVAFVNVTGFTKVVPVTLNTLEPYNLQPQGQLYLITNEYPWCGYNIVTYINGDGEQEISYQYYTFNQAKVKHSDCMYKVEESRNAFIDAESDKKLIRVVWVGIPYITELSDELLMTIATIYGGFKP